MSYIVVVYQADRIPYVHSTKPLRTFRQAMHQRDDCLDVIVSDLRKTIPAADIALMNTNDFTGSKPVKIFVRGKRHCSIIVATWNIASGNGAHGDYVPQSLKR